MAREDYSVDIVKSMKAWDKAQKFLGGKVKFCKEPSRIKKFLIVAFSKYAISNFFDEDTFALFSQRFLPEIYRNDKKLLNKIKNDCIYCYICHGIDIWSYFYFKVYSLNEFGRKNIVGEGKLYRIYHAFNNADDIPEIDSKSECYNTLKPLYKRELIYIASENDKEKFEDFLKTYGTGIVKPNDSFGGKGVKKVTVKDLDKNSKLFEELFNELGDFTVEELICQSDDMAYFNESSVNSVRALTVRVNGVAKVLLCELRYGGKGSFVDNVSSGGYNLQVDPVNGVTYGTLPPPDHTLDHVSGKRVIGIQLPDWDKFISCAVAASDTLPQYRLLAFDFAHSKDNGWVMVESNNYAEFPDRIDPLTYDKLTAML